MIFETPEELVKFFNKLDLDKSTLVFNESEKHKTVEESVCECGGACGGSGSCGEKCSCSGEGNCKCGEVKTESINVESIPNTVLIESLADSPEIKIHLSESDEDIFYVSDYNSVPDACGTGMLELPDRKSYMNMCEMGGVATVDLNIIVEGQPMKVKFQLAKTEDEPYIVLNKKHINL